MNDTTPNIPRGDKADELEGMLRMLQRLADATKNQQVIDKTRAFTAAISYNDQILVESTRASLLAAYADVANGFITEALGASEGTQKSLGEWWRLYLDKKVYGFTDLEEFKDRIVSIIDERLVGMLENRKLVLILEKAGQQVEKSQTLEDGIRQLRKFREEYLRGWPSRSQPAPIDREAIAKAREAIRAGEKGLSKDQMIWMGQRSEKSV